MATEQDAEPSAGNMLVRSFSDELQKKTPGDALARGLAAKIIHDEHREDQLAALRDQWNLFLLEGRELAIRSVPQEEAVLIDQSRKLYAAWTKFCQRLPIDQHRASAGSAPSLRILFDSVKKASLTWQEDREGKKTGRLKQVFANLCNTFKDHSTLLSVIPSDDKYVCLLTGSLSAIAQASTNHQQIASGVANSLEELSQDIAYWNSLITDHGNPKLIHRYILELYVVVFEFLTEIFTSWSKSSWKRFLTSFDERAFDKLFGEKRGRIRSIEQKIVRLTDLEFRKGMTEKVNKMEAGFQSILHSQESANLYQKDLLLTLGTDIQRLLSRRVGEQRFRIVESKDILATNVGSESVLSIESPPSSRSSAISFAAQEHPQAAAPGSDKSMDNHPSPNPCCYSRHSILDLLKRFADKFGHNVQSLVNLTSQASQVMIDPQVQSRILSWNKDKNSSNLWIQGPHDVSNLSQNTLTAVCLVALSRQNDIPCIFYFCNLNTNETGTSASPIHREVLKDMVESLIVQLALFLPERIVTEVDLSSKRFESLQSDTFSIKDAIQQLCDLRSLVPQYLHWIISGVQHLEDRDDVEHTRDLLCVLDTLASMQERNAMTALRRRPEIADDVNEDPQQLSPVTKLCFTTDGYMDALAQFAEKDRVDRIEYTDEAHEPAVGETIRLMPSQMMEKHQY